MTVKEQFKLSINPPVFFSVVILTISLIAFASLQPTIAADIFNQILSWITINLGWFYVLAVAGFLVFVVGIALSSYGRIKLGTEHSQPEFSNLSWFAMLFSAGMGIGLMFFGVAEPVMHYVSPPVGEAETAEAARQAMRITFFHWGLHAWAIYAVVAMSLAYFSFRHSMPMTISSALYPIFGQRINGWIGHTVDTFAVLGTIFGVATSLGFGVVQINAGLNYLFDIPVAISTQMLLIAIITTIATGSVALGLDGGIRRLSIINMVLAIILLAYVLIMGPTVFLLQTLVQNTGMYISNLFSMTFNLYAYEPTDWIGGWTLFYWGWWIAWAPFVGMFIALVSRGRTIREFVVGVLLVPVGFTIMWMTFFGNTALHLIMVQGMYGLAEAVSADTAVALFQFLQYFPLSGIISLLATILVITFFVTSADSGALVVDRLTAKNNLQSSVWQRIFWAIIQGLIAAVLLAVNGLAAFQTAIIVSALPFILIMILMVWGLMKSLKIDLAKHNSLTAPQLSDSSMDWRHRLSNLVKQPEKEQVISFIHNKVKPALQEVLSELQAIGLNAEVKTGEDERIWLEVYHHDQIDFFYAARLVIYQPPSLMAGPDRIETTNKYYRIEVFLREGGQGYDIMGWNKDTIINDVVEHYARHLYFLEKIRH
jgi:choline/glycine/proline betaine transport protein